MDQNYVYAEKGRHHFKLIAGGYGLNLADISEL